MYSYHSCRSFPLTLLALQQRSSPHHTGFFFKPLPQSVINTLCAWQTNSAQLKASAMLASTVRTRRWHVTRTQIKLLIGRLTGHAHHATPVYLHMHEHQTLCPQNHYWSCLPSDDKMWIFLDYIPCLLFVLGLLS